MAFTTDKLGLVRFADNFFLLKLFSVQDMFKENNLFLYIFFSVYKKYIGKWESRSNKWLKLVI